MDLNSLMAFITHGTDKHMEDVLTQHTDIPLQDHWEQISILREIPVVQSFLLLQISEIEDEILNFSAK